MTGPGVTTCRLVSISPRFASITKPVACAVVFHSVSKARTLSIWMLTTPVAMRDSVWAQLAVSGADGGAASAAGAACTACAACAG